MKKSIFLFFAAILCAMSVQGANTMRIYCKQAQSWWKADDAAVGAHYWGTAGDGTSWPGNRMTKVSGQTDLWYIDVDIDKYQNIIFTRVSGSGSVSDWGAKTGDLTIANTKNQYTISSSSAVWGNPGVAGSWETYKPTSTAALATSAANIIVGGQATLTSSLTSNASANTIKETAYAISPAGANVSGNTFTATAEGTYTVTATVTYYPLGCPTLTSTATATATITVASASEPQHDVKVTWMSGTTELQPSQTISVGESTGYPVEAPEFKDYTFSGWTLGTGVQSANETANPINITTKASGEYTLVANYDYIEPVIKTIYCKMEYEWWTQGDAAISAYASGTEGEMKSGLGTLMTLALWESNVWKLDIDIARYQKVQFIRVSKDGKNDYNARTAVLDIPTDTKDLYTITQSTDMWYNGSYTCPGTWSTYTPAAVPDRYLTGNAAGFGMTIDGEGNEVWSPNSIKMTWDNVTGKYTHTVTGLEANKNYKFRITDGTWNGKWGYSCLKPAVENVLEAGDDNINFVLTAAGSISIEFDGTNLKLTTTSSFAAPVYTIVGVETLTGSDWNLNDANNNMTQSTSDENIYTLEKNVELAAGDYTYKAVRNYSYDWSVPSSGNNSLKVEEAGSGKITYTLNVANYTLEAELSDWVTGSVAQNVKLVGIGEEKVFTEADDQTTTSVEVELEANQIYTFNVVVNGTYKYNNGAMWRSNCTDWAFDNAGMGQVATIITDLAGTYTFTWTYEGNKLSVTYPDGTNVPAPVFLGGDMNGWSWTNTRLIPSVDGTTASVTVNLSEVKTYEFKIRVGDSYFGNDGTMDRAYHGDFIFSEKKQDSEEEQEKAKISADVAGDYTFTWKFADNSLTVTYPEVATPTITLTTDDNSEVIAANIGKTVNVKIERSFTANDGYYTLCVPFNMPASVIGKAYSLGTITEHVAGEGININLEEVSELLAGVPYLVLPKANMSELVVENVTIQSDIASGQNVTGGEDLNVQIFFEGFYSTPAAPNNQTNGTTQYYVGEHGYLYNGVVDIRGLSGLFTITDKNGAPLNVRARVVTREDEATGLENITNGENTTIKVIENGQLIIIRGNEKFNAQGQKL